jgi:hypothetical protein
MRWRLQLEEYDYEIKYRAGTLNTNADCLSRIHVIKVTDNNSSEYELFTKAEEKPIFNSQILEIEGSIKNADQTDNLILPIPENLIITQTAIRDVIDKNKIDLTGKNNINDKFIKYDIDGRNIIFYKIKPSHLSELTPEIILSAISEIRKFCEENGIKVFSTTRLEGLTTLSGFQRVRTMFIYQFKNSGITVKIFKEQQFSESEKKKIIYEFHDTPIGGHSGVSRTIKRMNSQY